MTTISAIYYFRYTTKGGAHRYAPRRNSTKPDVGEIYLRHVADPPRRLRITVEAVS